MKASTPSLILFFVTSVLAIIFKLLQSDMLMLYTKSVVVPSLFIYYLVSNNYKTKLLNALIFLLFFVREVFNTLRIIESPMGSFLCVLMVYILLLFFAWRDSAFLKYKYNDIFSISLLFIGMGAICFSVLNLKLENLELDFSLYVVFGLILSLLTVFSILNYIKAGSLVFFNGMLMCVSFVISDVFFVLYKFYFYNYLLTLVSLVTQFSSYFFMVNYFLEKERRH
ncbi:hypothetical protein C8P67_104327 [Flavobacterium aquicola]|uniref:YhhN-like protein n=1 Tax=Flavobacterium aquicola TaxID=1682742 RepID=A0A3E0ERC6_9FLAO|nr:hypothetical protein C8P67_104327 [Flavobacterium aquicola]